MRLDPKKNPKKQIPIKYNPLELMRFYNSLPAYISPFCGIANKPRRFSPSDSLTETFEKCQFLFKFKKGDNFNHPSTICRPTGQAGIHGVFRGLKFEPEAEIEQKRAFFKGL
jgi:hypothetical protein